MEARTRIFVVDDHSVTREGLRVLLEREADMKVVGEATTGREALERIPPARADVAIVDLSLPDLPGDEVIRRIAKEPGSPAVLAHALADTREGVRAAIAAGARAYVPKSAPLEEVVEAVRALARGEGFISPSVAPLVLALARAARPRGALTTTDRAVLHGIARGDSSAAIAARLGTSPRSVETARTRLRVRLGARGTADLVRSAIAVGLVDE